jgi:hypothetical protein
MKLYQDVLEVISHKKGGAKVRVTQEAIEVAYPLGSNVVRVTQSVIEMAFKRVPLASRVGVE